MTRYNFGAGPAMSAPEVLLALAQAERRFPGTHTPLSSINHRHPVYEAMVDETVALVKKILQMPPGYSVLFVPGGATTQFTAWALNIIDPRKFTPSVCYVDSGHWGLEAYELSEGLYQGHMCYPRKVASSAPGYRTYPRLCLDAWRKPVDYLHVVTNETVNGTQLPSLYDIPQRDGLVVVADMTSEIFSRPIPFDRFGVVYAGTQKQLGISGGLVMVIVRNDLLRRAHSLLPEPLCYLKQLEDKGALRNTVPTMPLYSVYLTLKWIERHGGIRDMEERAQYRAQLLYNAIDESAESDGFYQGIAEPGSRSRMNVTFRLQTQALQPEFIAHCENVGLVGLKGHSGAEPYLGPHLRASLYNVMPVDGVFRLIEVMHDFKRRYF